MQGRINGTVIPYGPKMQRSSVEQKTRQVATAPVPTASEMAGYMARNANRSGNPYPAVAEGVTQLTHHIPPRLLKGTSTEGTALRDAFVRS